MIGYYSEVELEKMNFLSLGRNVKISKTSQLYNIERISIGDNVRIDNFCTIVPSGDAKIIIGNYVQICAYNFMNGQANITIEDYCSIGNFTQFFSSMDDFSGEHLSGAVVPRALIGTFSKEILVKKHALIAPSCIILPGVTIETGTAIGALSLVKESTKEFSIYAGVPAKFIKTRSKKLLELERKINLSNRKIFTY